MTEEPQWRPSPTTPQMPPQIDRTDRTEEDVERWDGLE